MAFICGSSANQEDDFELLCPKKTARRNSFCSRSSKDSKNPYSNRGLDKFEALLADLDGKRQKIYTQKGSEDISLVRFVYSNSNDVRPIVVKIRDQRKQGKEQQQKLNAKTSNPSSPEHPNSNKTSGGTVAKPSSDLGKTKNSMVEQLRKKFVNWWKPWYCLPVFVMLILVFLVFFGRSLAIVCTSVGWYMMPTMNATSENQKTQKKMVKKEYLRRSSEKMINTPRSNEQMNPQPHRRSF